MGFDGLGIENITPEWVIWGKRAEGPALLVQGTVPRSEWFGVSCAQSNAGGVLEIQAGSGPQKAKSATFEPTLLALCMTGGRSL